MIIGIPTEQDPQEKRVAISPGSVKNIINLGFSVKVQTNAGATAGFYDQDYISNGAEIESSADAIWSKSDIIIKIRPPVSNSNFLDAHNELSSLNEGLTLICAAAPAQNPDLLELLSQNEVTTLSMDAVPRISRAQKLDTLSSMANIAGYRAVIEAANQFGRFFTGQVTAAGKVPPARVLVIGAGVAGLAAIGAASSMGAIVRAFDTRPEVKEQVESMGAEFLTVEVDEDASGGGGYAKVMSKEFIDAEMALFAQQATEVDIIITTALIPGKPAPKLIVAETARLMKPGSVIVDLAAEQGGNCELTKPGEINKESGITIIGYTDLPSRMAAQSSTLYGNNVVHLLNDLTPEKDGKIDINMDDEVIRGLTIVHKNTITWPPPTPKLTAKPNIGQVGNEPKKKQVDQDNSAISKGKPKGTIFALAIMMIAILAMGSVAPSSFMGHFTVFVLAIFVGWQVIWNVTPSLHTPLMSVTNAISGIIVIGALVQMTSQTGVIIIISVCALFLASINIFGGFWVTQRMLRMFKKD